MKVKKIAATVLAFGMFITGPGVVHAQSVSGDVTSGVKLNTDWKKAEFSLKGAECLGEFQTSGSNDNGIGLYASPNSITESLKFTIDKEGGLSYLAIGLAPTQIVQATLTAPDESLLDYDLYLYEMDGDGNLSRELAKSTLTPSLNNEDGSNKTVDEGISYINNSSAVIDCAIIVHASKGCSATEEFTLTLSLDEQGYYDGNEPNDSPYYATQLPNDREISFEGSNLNVSNDRDWYMWKTPDSTGLYEVSVNWPDYKVKVYRAQSDGSMKLETPTRYGSYALVSKSYYYFCVSNNRPHFSSNDYKLNIKLDRDNIVTSIRYNVNGDWGTERANFYGDGSYYRFEKTLDIGIDVKDSNGFVLAEQPILVKWISGATGAEAEYWVKTDNYGCARVIMTLPDARGVKTCGVGEFLHYYDLDTIRISCGASIKQDKVYHYKYSIKNLSAIP